MTTQKRAWLVCLTASLFFFFMFIQMMVFNAISPYLMQDFNISVAQVGDLSTYFFLGNIIFLFPAGIILDRVSPHKTVLTALFLLIVGTFIFGLTHSYLVAALSRLITGIGAAFSLLGCIKIASRWFPPKRMALAVGTIVTVGMLGGLVAQTPVTLMVDKFGWHPTLLGSVGLGIIVLVLIALIVRDHPVEAKESIAKQKKHLGSIGFWRCLGRSVAKPQNWLAGAYTSLLNLPIFILGGMWGISYLVDVKAVDRIQASYITSMIFIGMMIGSPLLGWISDKICLRRLPMIVGAIFALVLIFVIMYVPNLGMIPLLILFFLLGIASAAQVIGYPLVAESNPQALTATATSLASLLIMFGGYANALFGWILSAAGSYNAAMWIMPIAFIVGLIAAFLAKESHCKSLAE
jgi:predicted MFS family arabinose efflux permease